MRTASFTSLIIIFIALVGGFALYAKESVRKNYQGVFCTMEAKMCPDGSYVGRTGPQCQFAECPITTATSTSTVSEGTTARINQKILNNEIYITPLEVISDSRCPQNAVCVWAGQVVVKIRLQSKNSGSTVLATKETNLILGAEPFSFAGKKVSLIGVLPETRSSYPITENSYRFTFSVTSVSAENVSLGTVSGTVTTSPTCPVERIPPEPGCEPRGYSTSISIKEAGKSKIIKTIQSNSDGKFSTTIASGSYVLEASGGSVLPRCNPVSVTVKINQNTVADISCDSGIR